MTNLKIWMWVTTILTFLFLIAAPVAAIVGACQGNWLGIVCTGLFLLATIAAAVATYLSNKID